MTTMNTDESLEQPHPHNRSADLVCGCVLGNRYRIVDLIARGSMGTVYRAEDLRLNGRSVAAKVMHPHIAARPEFVRRFVAESEAAALICHPAIVVVYDRGWTDDRRAYLVMEYVPGRTLKAVIQREPLSEEMAIRVALQLAGAVRAVHHAGLLHCDIKPENIMVADNGQYLKLVDFGISRAYRKRSDAASTHLLATPEYFSPELRAGQYSIQSDIYAFMCVLYQLIVGQPPFTGTSPLEVIQAHCSKAPLSIRMQRPEVSVKLEQIVMQGLDKRPERRQRTMDEVITALGGLHFQERSLTQPQPLRTWTRLAAALLFGVVLAGIMSQPQAVLRAALSEPAWDPVIVQQRLRELQERIDVASRRYHTALTSFPSDPEASAAVREERKRLLQLISTLEAFCQEAFAHATAEEDSHGTRAAILEALTYGRARQQQYAPP